MMWTYHQPRVLTSVSVLPVPFGLSSEDKPDKVPCVLQYWDQASQQFLGYIDFHLSENDKCILPLPEVRKSHNQDLVVAQTWRVIIQRGRDIGEEEERSELLVLPASLAACMSVGSCFIPALIPVVQGCISLATVQLHIINHQEYLGKGIPVKLFPFTKISAQPDEQEFAVISMEDVTLSVSHLMGRIHRSEVQVASSIGVDVLEYRNLTMDTLLQLTPMDGYFVALHNEEPPLTECNFKTGSAVVRFGRGSLHTLTSSMQAWSVLSSRRRPTSLIIFSHFIICNDTNQMIRFGQVGTDENLMLSSREMYTYSWRSHKSQQHLHLCMDTPSWKWCQPFQIDTTDSRVVRMVSANDQCYTVIIKIKQLTNNLKQIVFSGQLVVSSQLSQSIAVNLITKSRGHNSVNTTNCLGPWQTAPSFVVEPHEVVGMKFRVGGSQTAWTQEIHVSGDKMRDNFLLKIPLPDKLMYIHVWCRIVCQHIKDTIQTLVLLSPLYILRSYLPRPLYVDMETPRLQQQHRLEVAGHAQEYQLHCVGGDITHNLSFRLAPSLRKSSPPFILSSGLVDQLERQPVEHVDIDQLCYTKPSDPSLSWPFSYTNDESTDLFIPSSLSSAPTKMSCLTDPVFEQPSVDLSMRLSEYMPGCSTLLVDITPWCLFTNLCGMLLVLVTSLDKETSIPHGQTFTPPVFPNDKFYLAVRQKNQLSKSAAIPISDDEVANKMYSSERGRVLFADGFVHVTIQFQGQPSQILFFTVCSEIKHNMRVISVRERFSISNLTSVQFELRTLTVPLGHSQIKYDDQSHSLYTVPSHKDSQPYEENLSSLLTWTLLTAEYGELNAYVHYIVIREVVNTRVKWSLPLRIVATDDGTRLCVSVPGVDCYNPYCVTAKIHHGITYLVLKRDLAPQCVITNNCLFPIMFGQALMNISLSGSKVQEEAELIDSLPTLDPGMSTYYTMPYVNAQYPAANAIKFPRMHFCASIPQDDKSMKRSEWSTSIDIMSCGSIFVNLPQVADIKVESKTVAMVAHIMIEPISKAEISARVIRSRLTGAQMETKFIPINSEEHQIESPTLDVSKMEIKPVKKKVETGVYSIGVFIEKMSMVLIDETTSTETFFELLKLSCDNIYLSHLPVSTSADSVNDKSCLSMCVGSIQLDNQQYGKGQYDFPVLVIGQETKKVELPDLEKMTVTEKHAVLRQSSLLHIQVVMATDSFGTTLTESIEVSFTPVSLYIDDTFVYRVLREIGYFIPISLHCDRGKTCSIRRLPKGVGLTAYTLSRPLRIHYLCIHPFSILLSIHASMKLFLASDHTPLSFGKFEMKNLYASSNHKLARALAMHYATGAIFRAGIVIGSLEILGNPTGLIRSIGTGIADLFRLPYAGLTRGPGAFIGGMSSGVASLFKNVSAGMITSVTNFASSVSRNMDRLSLDSSHVQRQEECRRNRPMGVSDGLVQGLTGFGLSLLGAVAGLADQPIQSLLSDGEQERRVSRAAAATGLVAGMGKGLVGIVTKPIGGAAEFVSQTGQGILHGTGLGQLPERRETPSVLNCYDAKNGVLKYMQKIFSALPATEVLLAVDGLYLDLTGLEVEVTLLLTPEIVFVVNTEEDAQQQAFAVGELDISECLSDESLITIVWNDNLYKSAEESETSNKDRVAAFIDSAPTLAQQSTDDVSDSQSESLSPSGSRVLVPQYQFRMSPFSKELLLVMFQQAKDKCQGRGFPL